MDLVHRALASLGEHERHEEARLERRLEVVLVVLVGPIVGTRGEPELYGARGGAQLREVASAVQRCGAERVIFTVAGWAVEEESEPVLREACVRALGSVSASSLVAVGLGELAQPTLESLFDGLAGRALDPAFGVITLASLAADVTGAVPGAWMSRASHSLAPVFSLGKLIDALDPRLSRRRGASIAAERPVISKEDLTGTVLPGQFRVDGVFARGGFGTIYRARQLQVDRDVAIKVLNAAVDPGSSSGRQFVQEVQSVARIDHPNVVRIYQADLTADGRLFFAMELLEGKDLEQLAREHGVMEPARAVRLIIQLLAGLGAAHEAGLVHADIKPANALVVERRGVERLVLVDFGLSRLRPGTESVRSVGGTPAYMAPEQLREGQVDARSDLFSAALVLVTLLTGWRRHSLSDLVPPLTELEGERLRGVLQRALAIDPAERFPSAAELATALEGALREPAEAPAEPLAAAVTPPVTPLKAPRSSRRRIAMLAALGVGLGLVVAGARWWRSASPPAQVPTVVVGGSGGILYGFLEPLRSFLEEQSATTIPIDSKFDLGSLGAIRSLRSNDIDVAALSSRLDRAAPEELRAAGKLLLEVPIGFDETALFVQKGNPLRRIDLAAVREHLCCGVGEARAPVTWRALGLTEAPLADQQVRWLLFGRTAPPVPKDTTSSTLVKADQWLCGERQLCAPEQNSALEEASADEVLHNLVTWPEILALSSRALATWDVAQVVVFDRSRAVRLDGRRVLWLYLPVAAGSSLPAHLCRFLDAVLGSYIAERLARGSKAQGLPDAPRVKQRDMLGLDDGSCSTRAISLPTAAQDGVLRSSIGDELEISQRWVPEASP